MKKIHTLKTWCNVYQATKDGIKTFEIRRNDRNFKTGDILVLQEYNPDRKEYTGEVCAFVVTYMLQGVFGLPKDMCAMSIKKI